MLASSNDHEPCTRALIEAGAKRDTGDMLGESMF